MNELVVTYFSCCSLVQECGTHLEVRSLSSTCPLVVSINRNFIAFLPSSFAMYACTLAFAFGLAPPSVEDNRRTLIVTLLYATGAIVGWPFALALAIPFVFEELFILGADRVIPSTRRSWILARWKRLIGAGLVASLIFVSKFGYN